MDKMLKKFTVVLLVIQLGSFMIPPTVVFSDTVNTAETFNQTEDVLSDSDLSLIDEFTYIENNRFYLREDNTLTDELELIAKQNIQDINQMLEYYQGSLFVDESLNSIKTSSLLLRASGKNGVEFRSGYIRVYLSAGTVSLALQTGAAIGGIYAPAKSVQAALAILGISASQIKRGIWFDYMPRFARVIRAGLQ